MTGRPHAEFPFQVIQVKRKINIRTVRFRGSIVRLRTQTSVTSFESSRITDSPNMRQLHRRLKPRLYLG